MTHSTKGFHSVVFIFGYSYIPYRFAFNGQEKTDEIAGAGNHNTAEFWEYDTRIGRRWNLDPKPTFGISDYAAFLNSPIWFSDLLGDTVKNEGFKAEKLLKSFAKGLKVSKEDNPFEFKDNKLQVNEKNYLKLSPEQQTIASNIKIAIEDEIVFI